MKKMVQNFIWKMHRVKTRVQEKLDGPEFYIEDVDDQTGVQDDAEGPEFHRAGVRTARQARRGSHYGSGVEVMKVHHTIPEE